MVRCDWAMARDLDMLSSKHITNQIIVCLFGWFFFSMNKQKRERKRECAERKVTI